MKECKRCGVSKGRLRAGQLCNDCYGNDNIPSVDEECNLNSMLNKNDKIDYGGFSDAALNTPLAELTVVGLVNIIKIVIANVEQKVDKIEKRSYTKS